jgi:uncharacterized protein
MIAGVKVNAFTPLIYRMARRMGEGKPEKSVIMGRLLDYYGGILTERQRDIMDLHYNADLSLAEIAQQADISRQGVHDALQRAEASLCDLESRLGVLRHQQNCRLHLENAKALINAQEHRLAIEAIDKAIVSLEED